MSSTMRCAFIRIDDRQLECTRCGRTIVSTFPPEQCHARCRQLDEEGPSLLAMATSATNAFATWMAAGMPRRSAAEIEATFAICERCPQFDVPSSSCRRCGCGCSSAESVLNKITLATEHCPDGYW